MWQKENRDDATNTTLLNMWLAYLKFFIYKILTKKWAIWAGPAFVSSLPIRARLADFVARFTWTIIDITIETRRALCHAIRGGVKVREITAFTRRCRSIAGLALQIAPFASFAFSNEKASATRRCTFERHIWTSTLDPGIFCVSAVVSSNSTLKRENIAYHHYHHHYCHHYPACTKIWIMNNQDSEGRKNWTVLMSNACRKRSTVRQLFPLETAMNVQENDFIIFQKPLYYDIKL